MFPNTAPNPQPTDPNAVTPDTLMQYESTDEYDQFIENDLTCLFSNLSIEERHHPLVYRILRLSEEFTAILTEFGLLPGSY
ncbi:hypothetical protein IMZ48_11920 [Candidatus Bathyarchaeota archaeon]|nr:hypothetical protein [Candidatus Bathyarchaeota archaeon]